ncbi:electron transfer flavoprotein subunit beta/FixA family protein [Bacteroidales bacterium]
MKILVLIGNVPDTTTKIKFNADKTAFDASGVQWIINPWDELALTRAMELKETAGSGIEQVTVANVGKQDTEATLRKALAIGADKAIRVDAEPKDAFFVATQLAQVAKGYDLIFSGIEASDYNGAAVGGMLAEILEIQSVSGVSNLQLDGNKVKLVREIEGGSQNVQLNCPMMAIVQKGIAKEPRIPAMRGIMMARTKPLEVVAPVDTATRVSFASFDLPPAKAACKKFTEDQVSQLIHALRDEAKVL